MFDRPEKRNMNAKVRAYGKARIDIARHAKSREDWDSHWKKPQYGYPFQWGENWKQCVEYRVDDFAAEVGFYIDILCLPVNAFDPNYAMFTSPDQAFYLAVVPTLEGEEATPIHAIRFQFMVTDLLQLTEELEKRGIVFEQTPQPVSEGSSLYIGSFRTPHGILIELWSEVEAVEEDQPDELTTAETETEVQAEKDENQPEPVDEAPNRAKISAPVSKKPELETTLHKEIKHVQPPEADLAEQEPIYVSEDEAPEYHYRPISLQK